MNSTLAQEDTAGPPSPRKPAPWRRWLPPLLIVAAALAYYGSYLGYWFNPHDEGGTVCLVAQRLMHGERPWVDVELGYNIGWFYPVAGLFHLTGVNYLVARGFFFALSTLTALLGYGIVRRLAGPRWLALAVGLVLVVLPGSQFKNYIPLAGMANLAALLHLVHVDFSPRRKWFAALALGGAVLGLTALVRVEIAIFFAVIWALLLLLVLLDKRLALAQRATRFFLGAILLTAVAAAVQVPAYLYVRKLGVEQQFLAQVPSWVVSLRTGLRDQIGAASQPAPLPAPAPAKAVEDTAAGSANAATPIDRSLLQRRPIADVWHQTGRWNRLLAFLTYAPFVGFGVFFLAGVGACARRVLRGDFLLNDHSLKWLLLVGGSLTTFPQFFFFRPDRPHLSEFMPGYILAMAGCVWLLWPRGEKRSRLKLVAALALALVFVGHLALFGLYAFRHPSAGTIAARFGRETKFAGDNGVRVRDFKRQATNLAIVRDAILAHSSPTDYVVCFPYMPGYNVMTNRPTYLRNVYVDNATHEPDWAAQTMREFAEKKPAVIVIDDRAINGTAASRFSRWAAPVYDYVKIHYARVAEVKTKDTTIQVFAQSFAPISQ